MNRLNHIAEQGYKVKYIWITDFKRYTLDLEESEKNGTPKPNLFDYMNVNKHHIPDKQDTHLLYKGSQRYKRITEKRINTKYLPHNNHSFQRNNTCVPENKRYSEQCILKKGIKFN